MNIPIFLGFIGLAWALVSLGILFVKRMRRREVNEPRYIRSLFVGLAVSLGGFALYVWSLV